VLFPAFVYCKEFHTTGYYESKMPAYLSLLQQIPATFDGLFLESIGNFFPLLLVQRKITREVLNELLD
jgi:hypothetical protein